MVKATKEQASAERFAKLLKKAAAEISTNDYTLDVQSYTENGDEHIHYYPVLSEGKPGVILSVGSKGCYEFTGADFQPDFNSVTAAEFRRLGLGAIIDGDLADDHHVKCLDFSDDFRDYMGEFVSLEMTRFEREEAEIMADTVITSFGDGVAWVVKSPRGFGNEIEIQAVKQEHLSAAKEATYDRLSGWLQVWTDNEIRKRLESDFDQPGAILDIRREYWTPKED